MHKIQRYEFLLEAVSPVAHHAEVFGNSAVSMRRKVRQPDGTFSDVPIITADTMRHGLREAVAYAFLDAAGLIEHPSLSEAALRLLFAGGMMTGRGDPGAVKLDAYREMIDLVPSIAIFGGCSANRVIPGRLHVEDATLVSYESERHTPEWVREWMTKQGSAVASSRAHMEEVQRVRMDPTLDPGRRSLLSDGERQIVEHRLLASEAAHVEDDAPAREGAKSSMMPFRFERICAGSLFQWAATATCWSELDLDTFHVALATFLYDARVGGKRGTGHGRIKAVAARDIEVATHARRMEEVNPLALAAAKGTLFREHVRSRADKIKTFLAGVDA